MVQAARSGVQNIAEGSKASATSKKTEIKLTNVARASLEELKLDYEDFLRQNGLVQWPPDHKYRKMLAAKRFRTADEVAAWIQWICLEDELHGRDGQNGQSGLTGRHSSNDSLRARQSSVYACMAANASLTLIEIACNLLTRQIATQAKAFEEKGGFTERLYRVRTSKRENP